MADKLCVLRAVSTGDNAHSSSGYYMLTGRPHQPMNVENANPGPPNDAPVPGALLGRLGAPRGGLPPSVTLPHRIFNTDGSVWPGQDAGFLGRAADPWLLNAELTPEGYRIQEIDLPADLDLERVEAPARPRRAARPRPRRPSTATATASALDEQTRQAFDLLRSPAGPAGVPPGARSRTRSATATAGRPFGQGVPAGPPAGRGGGPAGPGQLVSRPRRAAGEPLLGQPRRGDRPAQGRPRAADRPRLLRPDRGPRPPRAARRDAGRLHGRVRPHAPARRQRRPGPLGLGLLVALAGGGVRGGQVHGASDRIGAYPREGRVRPEDLSATIFHPRHRPDSQIVDPLGRPHPVSRGEVLQAIL